MRTREAEKIGTALAKYIIDEFDTKLAILQKLPNVSSSNIYDMLEQFEWKFLALLNKRFNAVDFSTL